jgi:hypothetical protein
MFGTFDHNKGTNKVIKKKKFFFFFSISFIIIKKYLKYTLEIKSHFKILLFLFKAKIFKKISFIKKLKKIRNLNF